ncbi:MAG: phosphocholine cytidylyltransferase/choline kinase family protein [Oscillospiraceae bacterium]|nr:phosphocholine cytidylyltransferase/choline kinase family protein [Oscillospiraceae bacterium]MCL2278305.1 phosphocholine cytidylyltransferase/choline kinase family protein [Oscillospiraceae bacterium]
MKSENFVLLARYLIKKPEATQRELAGATKLSLGLVNSTIKEGVVSGHFEQKDSRKLALTKEGLKKLDEYKVKSAIILAAGFGSRCVPLTYETPKGLLEVYGQPMIERQIEQVREKGITEIIIVVGYKKESFDYLIDKYGVKLVFNPEYAIKNNLSSLHCAKEWLDSSYVLMSDFWIEENIFNLYEPRSWYSSIYADGNTGEWCVTTSASDKIESIEVGGKDSWTLIGPAYFSSSFSTSFKKYLTEYFSRPGTEDYYWEHIIKEQQKSLPMYINRQTGNVHEFENLEELRQFDPSYISSSNSSIMQEIAKILGCEESEIQGIKPLKVGMTNHSFTFSHEDVKYIMRVPGEGTSLMINRAEEYAVYKLITPLGLSDDIIHIDPKTGYKITRLIENARVCDPFNSSDVKACMKKLRDFHEMKLECDHTFDIFERIEHYESLWHRPKSYFRDYEQTKTNVMKLRKFIESTPKEWGLTHIDAVPDNFLFEETSEGTKIRLIDWEYTGMQDPHVDIAMFAVYSMYDREHIEALIDSYFGAVEEHNRTVLLCPPETRKKIYAYIAMCGLLWSNWCEYKSHMGVEFGEYSLRQYRFAKDYYKVFNEMG